MDAIRGVQEVSHGGGGPALHMKFSRDAAIPRIPAPHLLKQGQLQLAGASFRDKGEGTIQTPCLWVPKAHPMFPGRPSWSRGECTVLVPSSKVSRDVFKRSLIASCS